MDALFNADNAQVGDWFALWQRVKPAWDAGYMLMARRVPMTDPTPDTFALLTSHGTPLPNKIERVRRDVSEYQAKWVELESEVYAYALAVLGEYLYFLTEQTEGEVAIGRVKLDGTELEVNWLGGLSAISLAPNAITTDGTYLYVSLHGGEAGPSIWRAGGEEPFEAVVVFPEWQPESLACDGTYLYWLDDQNPLHIGRWKLDGSEEPQFEWLSLEEIEVGEGGEGQLTLLEPSLAEANGAFDLCMSPDGAHIYALLFNEAIVQFSRDPVTGLLTPLEPERVELESKGQRVITISPDGKFVYVGVGGGGEDIAVLSRDAETGQLTFIEIGNYGFSETVGGLVISPDGSNLYATTFVGFENVLVQFARDAETGKLTPLEPLRALTVEEEETELEGMSMSPDGTSLYVALSAPVAGKRRVYQFSRDAETGLLSPIGAGYVSVAPIPTNPIVSPDGKNVYVSTLFSGPVLQFTRNPETGALTVLGEAPESPGSFVLGMSRDGYNVYKADRSEEPPVAQYRRDPETGLLVALEPPEAAGVFLSSQPESVYMAVSPDDKFVYFVGNLGVAMYSRQSVGPPRLSLDKGLTSDGTYLYFSGVGDTKAPTENQRSIGRVLLDGSHLEEVWQEAAGTGFGALAVDDTYLYWAHRGLVGRITKAGTGLSPSWVPSPAPDTLSHGLATALIPGEPGGDWELRIEKRLGGRNLLASTLVPAEEGWHQLEFDVSPSGIITVLLDGTTVVTTSDDKLLGGYVGLEAGSTRQPVTPPPPGGGPGVGKLRYRLDARSYFDPYATNTTAHKEWMDAKIDHAIAYSPILSYIPRFPSTLFEFYMDVWTGDNVVEPEKKVQIDKPSGRATFLEALAAKVEAGIEGLFFDDLNFAGGNRPTEEPEAKAWKEGLGLLLEEVRAAHPALWIEANPQFKDIWPLIKGGKSLPLAPGSEAADPDVERAVKAVDMMCKEFGIGPTSGIDTPSEYREVLEYAEWLHSRGVGLQWSPDSEASLTLDEYQQATALLVADGHDSSSIYRAHPDPQEIWWRGLDMGLGEPTSERERSPLGLWTRTFTNGVVYTVEPGGAEQNVTLVEAMVNSAGEELPAGYKLTLKPLRGALLLKVEGEPAPSSIVIGVRQFTMDGVLLDDLERVEDPLSNAGQWTRLPWAADRGHDAGEDGWLPSSADSGAYWNAEWFGQPEEAPPPKEEPEPEAGDPTTVVVSDTGGSGTVPFTRWR